MACSDNDIVVGAAVVPPVVIWFAPRLESSIIILSSSSSRLNIVRNVSRSFWNCIRVRFHHRSTRLEGFTVSFVFVNGFFVSTLSLYLLSLPPLSSSIIFFRCSIHSFVFRLADSMRLCANCRCVICHSLNRCNNVV